MRRNRAATTVAVAATLVGVTAAAATAPSWHTGVVVTARPGMGAGALSDHGDALAAGVAYVGGRLRMEVATRTGFTASWNARFLTGALNGGSAVTSGINNAGMGVVAWRAPAHSVQAAVRATRTGTWQIVTVPSGAPARGSDGFFSPSATVSAAGAITINWVAHEQRGWAIRSAFRSGPKAAWRATTALIPTVPANSQITEISVQGNAEGDAVAAWTIVPNGSSSAAVYVAVRAAHHAWRAPIAMPGGPGGGASTPSVAIASNGRTAIAWETPVIGLTTVRYATGRAATGVWSPFQNLAPGGQASIAINSRGALAAVWTVPATTDFLTGSIVANTSANGTTWSTQASLMSFDGYESTDTGTATLGDAGPAFASFSVHLGPGAYIFAIYTARPTGTWSALTEYGHGGGPPTANATGQALALTNADAHPWTYADSYDAYPRADLTAAATVKWLPGNQIARWTISIRNRGSVAAANVRVTASWSAGRFVSSTPPGAAVSGSARVWALGTMAPRAVRTITVTLHRVAGYDPPALTGSVTGTGLAPVEFSAVAPG
jgi:hypothetical protein